MVHAELTIINEQGIHLGPANKIANLADRYDCHDSGYSIMILKIVINPMPTSPKSHTIV